MSTSLILLIPVILLGIVGLLCFVGCGLPVGGLGGGPAAPVTNYTETILKNAALIAYWPLSEKMETDAAAELVNGITGSYIDTNTMPLLYPWPGYPVPNPPGAPVPSDAAPGTIQFAQPGIVAGDVDKPAKALVPPACMVVNGCYVDVPFNAPANSKFMPTESFTIEAWVRADWDGSQTTVNADRFVVDTRDHNPGTGFLLFAQADQNKPGTYHWAGAMGNGGSGTAGFTVAVGDEIVLGGAGTPAKPTYLALTFDGLTKTLSFFVNGQPSGAAVSPVDYMPNTTQPLWIGAGAPYVPRRPQPQQPADVPASPLFPFVGAIQDVALYNKALQPGDILQNFNNGEGVVG